MSAFFTFLRAVSALSFAKDTSNQLLANYGGEKYEQVYYCCDGYNFGGVKIVATFHGCTYGSFH